jgi:hypothetical protein
VQGKVALIEFLANCALEARHLPEPDAAMFSGLGDVCG